MRHKTKGFLYYGDSGFSTNGSLNVTVNNNGTPANYRDDYGVINYSATNGNAQLLGNVLVWAIQRANSPEYQESYKVRLPCQAASDFLAANAPAFTYWFFYKSGNNYRCGYKNSPYLPTGNVTIPANQWWQYNGVSDTWVRQTSNHTLSAANRGACSSLPDTLNCQ
jgi:hypothetical protein